MGLGLSGNECSDVLLMSVLDFVTETSEELEVSLNWLVRIPE